MRLLLLFSLSIFACKAPSASVKGDVDGSEINAVTAYWGGPYLVITDADFDCIDMAWARESYDDDEANEVTTDEGFKAVQFTYESSEVEESKLSIATRNAPALAWFLEVDDGEAASTQATTGTIELVMEDDWAEGSFDLTFGDLGSLEGEFVAENCINLKKRKYE